MKILQLTALCVITLCFTLSASADVINVDFEGAPATDTNHNMDDGVFSNPGGYVWTSIAIGSGMTSSLPTEYGVESPIDVEVIEQSGGQAYALNNNLQDSGIYAKDIIITGLNENDRYTIATYIGYNSGFQIQTGTGIIGNYDGATPTGVLPGTLNQDYRIFANLAPYETLSGDYAIKLFVFDGFITGMQIVPEPFTLSLLAFGTIGLMRRRKRQ
ncbi:MAG: PEP-CTERM sorting domain-containing protein [Planctomycetes bacterium]|nr:PEP-CTERM sorting domain-containing protein [Planctomycetota bacterium]